MTTLLTIDPGLSTGICLGTYSATEPYRRIAYWQPRRGVKGLTDWWEVEQPEFDEIVCERFTVYQALSHDSAEPLRVEGWLIGEGIIPPYPSQNWQEPAEMYFMAETKDPLRVKKKKAQDWLKRYGMWVTGAPVDHVDGADVNSATLHAIVAMRRSNHAPTLRAYFPPRAA